MLKIEFTMTTFGNIKKRIATAYALWRIKPTEEESRAYNRTDRILLSFDDYADGETIQRFLEILRNEKVKAAFFLVGKWAKENPDLVEAIRKDGHWIGNHSFSHYKLTDLSDSEVEREIANGLPGKLFRPPYGAYDARVRKIAAKLGYKIAFWTIDSDDWSGIDVFEIHDRVVEKLQPGACILLHLHPPRTVEVLPALIRDIRAKGFELCTDGNELSL